MDFAYTDEDEAFRTELVDWLDEHLPKFLAEWSDDGDETPGELIDTESEADDAAGAGAGGVMSQMERRRAWQRKLHEGRWAAISWPEDRSSRGLAPLTRSGSAGVPLRTVPHPWCASSHCP